MKEEKVLELGWVRAHHLIRLIEGDTDRVIATVVGIVKRCLVTAKILQNRSKTIIEPDA